MLAQNDLEGFPELRMSITDFRKIIRPLIKVTNTFSLREANVACTKSLKGGSRVVNSFGYAK